MTSTEDTGLKSYEQPDFLASSAIDRGVREIVAVTSGAGAFREEPYFEGAKSTRTVPDPMASIRALIMLRDKVNQELDQVVRKARGEGSTWEGIAVLLGFTEQDEDDRPPAERAFYFVAPEIQFQSSTTSWRCGGGNGCGARVTDKGPFDSYPENNEEGHRGFHDGPDGEKCPRHAAEIAAWEKRNNW